MASDPVLEYAEAVLAGRLPAGELVKATARRHLTDLDRDDLVWDLEAALRPIKFCSLLHHWEGRGDRVPAAL